MSDAEDLERLRAAVKALLDARADIYLGRTAKQFLLDPDLWGALKAELVDPALEPVPPGCVICRAHRAERSTCCGACWERVLDLYDMALRFNSWVPVHWHLTVSGLSEIVADGPRFDDDQQAIDHVRSRLMESGHLNENGTRRVQ